MANRCYTTYKATGSRENVTKLWEHIRAFDVNKKKVWLCDLADAFCIDWEKKGISVAGWIEWAEYEEEANLLSFETDTKWNACEILFEQINKCFDDNLSISYREIECGCEIFYVHDEGCYFPEEACVSSSGGPFEEACEDVYATVDDAINEWCKKMNFDRGERSEEEMLALIKGYVYEDECTYFYINKFIFE